MKVFLIWRSDETCENGCFLECAFLDEEKAYAYCDDMNDRNKDSFISFFITYRDIVE